MTESSVTTNEPLREFLFFAGWADATCEPLAGDASSRRYFRLRRGSSTVILMDASQNLESVTPFVMVDEHLRRLGFKAPAIQARAPAKGFLLLEDFGDNTFAKWLESGENPERLYGLAVDFLVELHKKTDAVPQGLRSYHPEKMLEDIELFLEWCTPEASEPARRAFREIWLEVLPIAHEVPVSLLLRDFHVANLMSLQAESGIRQVGLLDFQDAYAGPVTYDLVSLLEDARRDLPQGLREKLVSHYIGNFPDLDTDAFERSLAILAAQRHTGVLAIFERLSRRDGKHDYKRLHSQRVRSRLETALRHPALAGVKDWMNRYARPN